jgi:hypothetical protein
VSLKTSSQPVISASSKPFTVIKSPPVPAVLSDVFLVEPQRIQIQPNGNSFVTVTFSPQALQVTPHHILKIIWLHQLYKKLSSCKHTYLCNIKYEKLYFPCAYVLSCGL